MRTHLERQLLVCLLQLLIACILVYTEYLAVIGQNPVSPAFYEFSSSDSLVVFAHGFYAQIQRYVGDAERCASCQSSSVVRLL